MPSVAEQWQFDRGRQAGQRQVYPSLQLSPSDLTTPIVRSAGYVYTCQVLQFARAMTGHELASN